MSTTWPLVLWIKHLGRNLQNRREKERKHQKSQIHQKRSGKRKSITEIKLKAPQVPTKTQKIVIVTIAVKREVSSLCSYLSGSLISYYLILNNFVRVVMILANRMLLLILFDLNHIGDFCLTKDSGNLKMGLNDTKQFLQMWAYLASLFSVL